MINVIPKFFAIISTLSMLLPFISMLSFWKKHFPLSKIICLYVIIGLISSAIIEYKFYMMQHNIWILNTFIIIEFVLVGYFLLQLIHKVKVKWLFSLFYLIGFVFMIINLFKNGSIFIYSDNNGLISSIFNGILCGYLILQFVNDPDHVQMKDPYFILCLTFFIFFSISILSNEFILKFSPIPSLRKVGEMIFSLSFSISNIQLNICLAYALSLNWLILQKK